MTDQAVSNVADAGPKREAQELTEQSRLLYRQGELNKALAQMKLAYEAHRSDGDSSGVAESANDIGVLYTVLRRYGDAEKWLYEAHKLFVELRDYAGEAQALGNIGSMHRARGDLKQAAVSLNLAVSRFSLVGDKERQAATLRLLSQVRLRQLFFLHALSAYETALACETNPNLWHRFLRGLLSLPRRLLRR